MVELSIAPHGVIGHFVQKVALGEDKHIRYLPGPEVPIRNKLSGLM